MDIMLIAILFFSVVLVGITSLATSLDDGHWSRAYCMRLVGVVNGSIEFNLG